MTIDERLEALTQSVELLASIHKDGERQFEEHKRQFEEHRHQFEEHKRLVSGAIEALVENDRKLTAMLTGMREEQKDVREILTGMREDQKNLRHTQDDLRDAVMRLSVIAEAHQDTLDDHGKRIGGKQI